MAGWQVARLLVGCQIVQYVIVCLEDCSARVFKVKTLERDLKKALENDHGPGCWMHLWKKKNSVRNAGRLKAGDGMSGHGCITQREGA